MLARPCFIFYHLLLRDDPLVATLEAGQLVRGVEKHACGKDSYQLNCSRKKKQLKTCRVRIFLLEFIFVPLSQMPDSWQTAIWSTHTARRSYRSSCGIPPGNLNQRMSVCYRQQASRTICSSTLIPCILESKVIPGPPPPFMVIHHLPSQLLWTTIG